MATGTELRKFHGLFASSLRSPDLLGTQLTVRELAQNWKKKFYGDKWFGLFPSVSMETAVNDRGVQVVVVRLRGGAAQNSKCDEVPQGWVSWFENWRKQPDDTFSLVTAQWTLFWGVRGIEDKMQVCRAEWDQTAILEDKVSNAGQPHWHVDPPLPLTIAGHAEVTRASALEELPGPQELSRCLAFDRVHLAMGGWQNPNRTVGAKKGTANCACWQMPFSGDTADLSAWAVETLRYLKCECEDLF